MIPVLKKNLSISVPLALVLTVGSVNSHEKSHSCTLQPSAVLDNPPTLNEHAQRDDAAQDGEALWYNVQHSVEGEAYAGAVFFQILSAHSIPENGHSDLLKEELWQKWDSLSLSDRMHFLISQKASDVVWVSRRDFSRAQKEAVVIMARLMGELNQLCGGWSGDRPTRMVDIDPTINISPLADPESIPDIELRDRFQRALDQIQGNRYYNMKMLYYLNLKTLMDNALPAMLEQMYAAASDEDRTELAKTLKDYGLAYGDWALWSDFNERVRETNSQP